MEHPKSSKLLDDSSFEFTLAEASSYIVEMDNILKDSGDQTLGQEFFQDVALHFSCSPWRAAKSPVTAEHVHAWFENRRKELRSSSKKARPPPPPPPPPELPPSPSSPPPTPPPKLLLYHSESDFLTHAPSSEPPEFIGKATDLSELAFEAFSSRDHACRCHHSDVLLGDYCWWWSATAIEYLKCRSINRDMRGGVIPILCPWNPPKPTFRLQMHKLRHCFSTVVYHYETTGKKDARVRYAGFGKDEDEWVNVARGVRDRSIPLESSECYRVKVGDLVLCFRERQDHALYFDAYVVEIQRRLHDIGGCRCIFVVRYEHDHYEEKVHIGRLCCRPSAFNSDRI
ncbi:protein SAWADEE HOMEODOMAIN-like protein 1-like isoform X1 [Cucumis melo var. makuwa]|uniref:Protein SAWADEE HOMEODOMAIN-like protein 1-like isoform X1 n=1 Tax=Cucumis melo var. makuwa TaxID=1194695 RepID=A0A5D3C067_CUCMM|nr:protein SAWADEE HOMEODOMAIN-like protein 1-like isoform X1 [Cucumis melo var. makuwa]